ncbi:MAG: hypothetical protein EBU59_11460, partial [Planctomycetia bacterium]|nr:hypothetical protein [Planctomycetia bacterium]
QTFGESETFVLKVRQSTVTAAGVAFHVQFQRGASEELISPVERTGNRRLGRNTAGDVFSNTVPITYGEASLNIRFHDRWDIVDAEETVDGRNYVFAQAGGDGPRYRMLADSDWRIAGMESIGNASVQFIRRPMMRIAADQQIYAAEEPLLFADGSGIRQEPEDGWQAIAVERVQVDTAIPHSTDI